MSLQEATRRVVRAVGRLHFAPPVTWVYNPLRHAKEAHGAYLERFGTGSKAVLWLGMNPGPFGMVQTGVPFGEVAIVRDWMGITGRVSPPKDTCPKRPIQGFDCTRSEVSGRRLWGWVAARWDSPEAFFQQHFVHNYCPLAFLADTGRNITPDKLPAKERAPLETACDRYLSDVVDALQPRLILGVGAFAEQRARRALADREGLEFGRIAHPSPASPAANKGWDALADQAAAAYGLLAGR